MIKFDALGQGIGLPFDKKQLLICGKYQGYSILIRSLQRQGLCHITMSAKVPGENVGDVLTPTLQRYAASRPEIQFTSYKGHVISIGIKNTAKITAENVIKISNELVTLLRTNGMINCCQTCGSEEDVGIYTVFGEHAILCPTCFERSKSELALAQNAIHTKKTNYAFGIVGALLGSLLGVLIWVIAAQFGKIVGISGIVFIVGSLYGFKKLGGKLNIAGLIISALISVAMLLFAEYLTFAIEIFQQYKNEYDITFLDAFRAVADFLEDEEVYRVLLHDVVIGLLFLVAGGVTSAISIFKNENLKYKMERLDRRV